MSFEPKYTITPAIAQALARIEVTRHKILETPITASLITSLRESARLSMLIVMGKREFARKCQFPP